MVFVTTQLVVKKETHTRWLLLSRLSVAITNKRLFQMRKHPTGFCDTCEVTESIEHILLECNKENISTILKEKCNSYKSEFNLKSLLDTGCLQSTVYNLIKIINKGKIL